MASQVAFGNDKYGTEFRRKLELQLTKLTTNLIMFSLDKIFAPATIAAIGASDKQGTVGFALIDNLLKSGFKGKIFPVNPGHSTIAGRKSFSSVKRIPETVDLAVIATPAKLVPNVIRECGEAGVGGVVIISAGFKEAGKEGRKMYDEIAGIAWQDCLHFSKRRTLHRNPRLVAGPACRVQPFRIYR